MSKKNIIIICALFILLVFTASGASFLIGFKTGSEFPQNLVIQGISNIEPDAPTEGDFSVFWQAWQFINENYLKNSEVATQDKIYGAIHGLVRSLGDDNSEFFNPEGNQKFQEDIQGNFGGIGAEIGIRNDQLVIVAPLENTPAIRAGLKPGDQILKIDDESTVDITVQNAVTIIRGPVGTEVTLTIMRKDWEEPQDIKIVRGNITVPTLTFAMKDELSHIKIHSFNANTSRLLYDAAVKTIAQGAKGMILDVRNNPGGFLNVAVDVSGWFLEGGKLVVSEEGIGGERREFFARGNAAFADFPIVMLINQGSASASEILAGALRDHRKIKLIGEQSFGKGTVQQLETLKDGSSLKLTIAHWVFPSGTILDGEGLKPDIEVKISDEDMENSRDSQLEKAVEVLRSEIAQKTGE